MGLFDGIKEWFLKVALQKAITKGSKAGVASFIGITQGLDQFGVHVQVNEALLVSSLIAGGYAAYEFIRNFLKGKGLSFLP